MLVVARNNLFTIAPVPCDEIRIVVKSTWLQWGSFFLVTWLDAMPYRTCQGYSGDEMRITSSSVLVTFVVLYLFYWLVFIRISLRPVKPTRSNVWDAIDLGITQYIRLKTMVSHWFLVYVCMYVCMYVCNAIQAENTAF